MHMLFAVFLIEIDIRGHYRRASLHCQHGRTNRCSRRRSKEVHKSALHFRVLVDQYRRSATLQEPFDQSHAFLATLNSLTTVSTAKSHKELIESGVLERRSNDHRCEPPECHVRDL